MKTDKNSQSIHVLNLKARFGWLLVVVCALDLHPNKFHTIFLIQHSLLNCTVAIFCITCVWREQILNWHNKLRNNVKIDQISKLIRDVLEKGSHSVMAVNGWVEIANLCMKRSDATKPLYWKRPWHTSIRAGSRAAHWCLSWPARSISQLDEAASWTGWCLCVCVCGTGDEVGVLWPRVVAVSGPLLENWWHCLRKTNMAGS